MQEEEELPQNLHNVGTFDGTEYLQFIVKTDRKIRNRTFYCLTNDYAISKLLRQGFYWEEYMIHYYKQFYIPGTDVIDVGGHIGTNTLLFEEILSQYNHIYVFEPIYHRIIQKTLEENNIPTSRVSVQPVGLAEKRKKVSFKIHPWNTIVNLGAQSMCTTNDLPQDRIHIHQGEIPIDIEVVSLDLFEFSRRVSVVKIDVEGFELLVLRGMMKFIRLHQPTIFIEIWKNKLNEFLQTDEAKELFLVLNYKIAQIKSSKHFININENDIDEDDYVLYKGDINTNIEKLVLLN
jgi:FkbM family methyltransferase